MEPLIRERKDSPCDFLVEEEYDQEPMEVFEARVLEFYARLQELAKEPQNKNIAIFIHSGFIFTLTRLVHGEGKRAINGGLIRFDPEPSNSYRSYVTCNQK